MLSNALLISNNTTTVVFFWSMALKIASTEWINDFFVECHLLFPLWLVEIFTPGIFVEVNLLQILKAPRYSWY